MCISFVYFYVIKGKKVQIVKWSEVRQKYLVRFGNGTQQYVSESLLEATEEQVDTDKEWGKHYE